MTVKKVLYTASSRLVGYRLKLRSDDERLECWLGNVRVIELRRGQPDRPSLLTRTQMHRIAVSDG